MQIDQSDDDDGRADAVDTASPSSPAGARDLAYPPDPDAERQSRVARAMDSRGTADAAYRAYDIRQAHERISGIEHGSVTPVMKRVEAEDPERHLAGLENRLKGADRFTEKVTFDETDKEQNDEQFGRDLEWTYSSLLYSYERGNMDNKFYEISESEADQIMARIRGAVNGQA